MIKVTLISFGHKYEIPEADLVFDVRHLPNPHWEDELKCLTGIDTKVINYFESQVTLPLEIQKIENKIRLLMDDKSHKNKCEFIIAIGCTGGQHRSVYVVEKLAKNLESEYHSIRIEHKEQTKW